MDVPSDRGSTPRSSTQMQQDKFCIGQNRDSTGCPYFVAEEEKILYNNKKGGVTLWRC